MPATPRKIRFTAKDLEGAPKNTGGTWSEIEVGYDYELTLADVEDYDYRDRDKSMGWIFLYHVETSTGPCEFKVFLALTSEGARWKLGDIMKAHELGPEIGVEDFDPNSIVGTKIGGHIEYGKDRDGTESRFREITAFFPLVDAPEPVVEAGAATPAPEEPEVL